MDSSYYQSQIFDTIPEEKFNTPDGLVYNHLQQTLQVQTDLKNQHRVQEFLNSAVTEDESLLGFDELYSSVTTLESDMTYLQLMQSNPPFYTDTSSFCHPLDNLPECDYYLDDHDMLAGLNCNAFDSLNTFMPTYPSPIHDTAASMAMSNDIYRNNSTPMLSASFSFSSFSSASSSSCDPKPTMPTTTTTPTTKKSASMSFLPERSSIKRNKKKKLSLPSSDSYYSKQRQLSDSDDEEDFTMTASASTGLICKKGRNVDKACNHCKRSHLRCDNVRPCRRCVATGKIGCQDVKHKPRGRPRLQKRL
ncbi:hypothetical protein INT47_009727 [Mucor saturninus]|uniref:Zn(2)-C6 fungal-type domain-containing protein n=1 Tax=Mucor saturninus TaxID=64648 RepID=A0A8H7QSF9_9FUNG|nr:hypothetical protein INT47_009727 [Mucor saturninus]